MIRDLEVVLLSIADPTSRAYVQEAVRCYNAGAYRAAVVLAVAAGMDGLRQRLLELARSGGAPAPVVAASTAIERRFADQDAVEAALIDAAERDAGFFTPSEAGKARVVLKTRHLCAHPSGHTGTAEEARDAITSVVDLVLSRPATLGMSGVTTLIARLASPTFFPYAGDPAHARQVAAAELTLLHASLLPALVAKLVGSLRESTSAASAEASRQNALTFLTALVAMSGDVRATVWRYAERLVEDATTTEDALALATADPTGLASTAPLVRDRLVATVRRNLATASARRATAALVAGGVLTPVERRELVSAAMTALFPDDGVALVSADTVTEMGLEEVTHEFWRRRVAACGSTIFMIANRAIDDIQELAPDAAARIPADLRLMYVLEVAGNAARPYPSFSARSLVRDGLGDRADFLDALAEAAHSNAAALRTRDTNWSAVRALCQSSGRDDILTALVALFEGATAFSSSAVEMLEHLADQDPGALGARAQVTRDHVHALPRE